MTDIVWPPSLRMSSLSWGQEGNTAASRSPLNGAARTYSRPGGRLTCRVSVRQAAGAERAQLQAIAAALRGQANRIYLADVSSPRRGSFPATEAFANADFASGTTNWSATRATLRVRDSVLRAINGKTAGANAFGAYQSVTLSQYTPYALRALIQNLSRSGTSNGTVLGAVNYAAGAAGMITQSIVNLNAGAQDVSPIVVDTNGNVMQAGDYGELAYTSLARCFEVDNGPNQFQQSQDFSNAAWTKVNANVTPNLDAGPDGATAADSLNEDTSSGQHYVSQEYIVPTAAGEFCLAVAAKPSSRSWIALQWLENTGSTAVTAYFNVATGAVGTISAGANWSNVRTHSVDLGSGWFAFYLIARKTNAATSLFGTVFLATGDTSNNYLGDTSGLYLWRGACAAASVPMRLVSTTTATSGAAQSGSGLFVRGGPASTAGALYAGDMVEIKLPTYSHLARLTGALDFDAAGLGFMTFEPPLPRSPADGAPVIVHQPMGRFMLAEDRVEYETEPGRLSDFTFDLVQDITP